MDIQCGYYDRMCDVWENWSTYGDELDKQDKMEYYMYKHYLSLMQATGNSELYETRLNEMADNKNQEINKKRKRAFRKAINSLNVLEELIFN